MKEKGKEGVGGELMGERKEKRQGRSDGRNEEQKNCEKMKGKENNFA